MKLNTMNVDNQGRIILPSDWRRKNRVVASSQVIARETRDGSLLVETREQGYARAKAILRKHIPAGVSLSEELIRERRKEADRE